jgi:glycine dehydrogenase subunit 1
MNYILLTEQDQKDMLDAIGKSSVDELFEGVEPKLNRPLDLPEAMSELEVKTHVVALAEKNQVLQPFRGAGSYAHYVPAAVNHILLRGEFYTAYTPYQPEISQGTLQVIFEFQTLLCKLTAMDVTNASMYDAATALAEAVLLSRSVNGKHEVFLANPVNPLYQEVLKTYAGATDFTLAKEISGNTACVIVQYPDYHGTIEDLTRYAKQAHDVGALFVVVVGDPTGLAILKPPGEYGADVVVGDLQALGNGMNYGGPTGGFMTVKNGFIKKIPGRLCGLTKDSKGIQGFILTLQAREQHIRRERATSNICTNQALNALASTVYLALLGKTGLRNVASLSYIRAHLLQKKLSELGFSLVNEKPFYNEFVVKSPVSVEKLNAALEQAGYLGGVALENNQWLLCCTELNSEKDVEKFVEIVRGAMQ